MKRCTFALFTMLMTASIAKADEPPSWQPFRVCSDNQRFCAEVAPATTSDQPWTADWLVRVAGRGSTEVLWSSSYQHDGYTGGMLSEDGATFVQVSFWYYSDSPVITIYRAENRHSIDGKAFAISPRKLEKTVSHSLWLTHHQKAYEFVGGNKLRIITIDNREHLVNLGTGELSSGE